MSPVASHVARLLDADRIAHDCPAPEREAASCPLLSDAEMADVDETADIDMRRFLATVKADVRAQLRAADFSNTAAGEMADLFARGLT